MKELEKLKKQAQKKSYELQIQTRQTKWSIRFIPSDSRDIACFDGNKIADVLKNASDFINKK